MPGDVTAYLSALVRRLHLDPKAEQEIILELRTHLEDKAAELESVGLDQETAMAQAVSEMGRPDTVASRMYAVYSPRVWRDVLLATVPHFLLASLFALNLWSQYFLVSLLLIGIAFVTWRNWRAGTPSQWSYTWMGYTLAAPALSWLLALITLAYGGWTLITTGQLPFNVVLFFLLIGYVPFSMWIVFNVASKVMRRDWLLASLTALPFPFLTSWILFLNWQGGLWSDNADGIERTDTTQAFIFLALALTTAVFLKIGPRLLRIGLLTLATAVLVAVTAKALPVDFGIMAIAAMILVSVVFLLSPAVLESRTLHRRQRALNLAGAVEDASPWNRDPT